ncbi:MAG: DUF4013 domain-containing protein [Archaeoglobus sp.]|nr:DUF4013 domain-containing protein [Archaeoglobus sp.]
MQIEEIFADGIETSKKLLEDTPKLLLLVVLTVIPIIDLILLGYFARVIRNASRDLPEVSDFMGLFIEGLKIMVVLLIYLLIPIALILAGVWMTIFSGGFALGLFLAGAFLSLLIALIAAMGIVHMIWNQSFAKAFSFGEIIEIIRTAGWGSYLIWVLSLWVLSLVVSALSQLTPIGWVVTAFITPFFTVFAARTAYLIYSLGAGIVMD